MFLEPLKFRETSIRTSKLSDPVQIHDLLQSIILHILENSEFVSRHLAISNMLNALQELQLQSKFPVTLPYLISLFKDSEFEQNKIDTTWLDRRIASKKHTVTFCSLYLFHFFFLNSQKK